MIYITLALVVPVFLGICAAVIVLLKRFVAWSEAREAARTFARDFIPECIDVAKAEAALALKAAEADALAALDEVAALFADPDIALKLALLAEGRAA